MALAGWSSSPFLDPGPVSTTDSLAILHLKRDLLLPTVLSELDENREGYDEGRVTNTRFGSFPHSTLIGLPWGSQVRASNVDTGSRGRRGPHQDKKRKRDSITVEEGNSGTPTPKAPVVASTGFIHLLPPTPESWTASLPHRTQVVYTPDYSYILHRLRVRPGSIIIEAGAGSGSFSHASARAVFNGYPKHRRNVDGVAPTKRRNIGKVWSYEFHEQRVGRLREEIRNHGLEDVVEIVHRDVCEDGFLLEHTSPEPKDRSLDWSLEQGGETPARSPQAHAIFLDLPAPWLALRHLTREAIPTTVLNAAVASSKSQTPVPTPKTLNEPHNENDPESNVTQTASFTSPLNPNSTIRICTFSPCIEQVQRTVSTLRQLGWLEIEMVEIAHKRIEVRRERVGLREEGPRGANTSPATVDEAVERLKEVEGRFRTSRSTLTKETPPNNLNPNSPNPATTLETDTVITLPTAPATQSPQKPFKEGRLIHRSEPELKTHTSYLVFALLPQDWTPEQEARARVRWPVKPKAAAPGGEALPKSKKQMKKAARLARLEGVAASEAGMVPSPPLREEQGGEAVGSAIAAGEDGKCSQARRRDK
ncbi:MAG: tRNA (adenine-N(1)-)-methyltransferase catalytic subunit trm61 [Geoglossum umbratile]|nr:MAG: tRNA (adenine-N(1)-)-methyltransferase catalytic subunit trm61 [Geoglossum umbratile]